ncbi:MAG TPA: SpoIVB peptidase [Symbiobacteriaceae bacterium]|nr:SpoIVB peptidase [Symbiobacteriaceae bacterium]
MANREKRRRVAGLCLVALILALCATEQFRAFVSVPDRVRLPQGQVQDFAFQLPFRVTVHADRDGALALNGEQLGSRGRGARLTAPLSIAALQTGRHTVDLKLFGLIPFRKMTLDVVPPIRVVPGGHSIGVLLRSKGVIVVGYAGIRGQNGELAHPGRDSGIELGDAILQIGGREVISQEQAARLFEEAGKAGKGTLVMIKRKGKIVQKSITPVRDKESGRWRVGLFIRDGAAGVGTLSFYEPASGKYGALGHVIADAETSQPIDVREGHIVEAVVTAIQKGRKGAPGEKMAAFKNEDNWLGSIEKNSRFGIFGSMHGPLTNPFFREPVPAALASQVKEGPAEIFTVVEGQKMERFQIEIVRVMRHPTSDGKNMIVRITDPRLLGKTGGIVQGMSGSPIIQDGRMVGAVTHVFVNDPTRGYGALIEWMLQEAGVIPPSGGVGLREATPGGFLYFTADVLLSRTARCAMLQKKWTAYSLGMIDITGRFSVQWHYGLRPSGSTWGRIVIFCL